MNAEPAEFPAATHADWRVEADAALHGESFEKKLVSQTWEGIDLQPIYHLKSAQVDSFPGFPPFVRRARAANEPWEIAQEILFGDPAEFNAAIRTAIDRGQTALNVVFDNDVDSLSAEGLARAFEGVDFEKIPIFLQADSSSVPMLALFAAFLRQKQVPLSTLRGSFELDPLGELVSEGTLPHSSDIAFDQMVCATRWAASHSPRLKTIGVRANIYHDAGGNAVHELAFAIATAVEYLRQMESRGLTIDETASRFRFSFAIGSDFFMAIAKFRAARWLWARIIQASGGTPEAMHIHARTALWNKTALDPYVNMLRATTEGFAAAVGGCESMHLGAFDEAILPPDEFSRRIARNTQIILRDECHFDHVIDPAGGSPFVESLTNDLARAAWKLFQETERGGGMLKSLASGFPQEQVNAVFEMKAEAIAQRRERIVGVNIYANAEESPLQDTRSGHLRQKRAPASENNAALAKLASVRNSDELMSHAIEAAAQGAALGGLSRALGVQSGSGPRVIRLPVRRASEAFEKSAGPIA